jgi:hypothetical protein
MEARLFSIMVAVFLVLPASILLQKEADGSEERPVDFTDAYITGRVINATSGVKVSCQNVRTPGSGAPIPLFFNGTTNSTGEFNITVDSNSTAEPPSYSLGYYRVIIEDTYFMIASNGSHNFQEYIEKGEELEVPEGALELIPAPLGDLTIRIMNRSSGEPLTDARVSFEHPPAIPTIPFVNQKMTDNAGEVEFMGIRAADVIIEASRENFQDLSTTVPQNTGTVAEGSMTTLQFNLTENPWPFLTNPSSGALSANVSRGILVEFGTEMNPTSMVTESNYALKDESQVDIAFTVEAVGTENDMARVIPDNPLDYQSNYTFSIFPSIQSLGGWNILWRTMEVPFQTEKRPGIVRGRLVESGSGDPVEGIEIELVDQTAVSGTDGSFIFPLVIDGTYDLNIDASYLFEEMSVDDITVGRGYDIDLGNISIDAVAHGSMLITVTSEGDPLEGAWIKVLSSLLEEDEFNLTTNSTGQAFFQRVRSGNVNLRAGASHHSSRVDIAIVPEGGQDNLTIDLVEDDPPVSVRLTEEISSGIADPSSDFLLLIPEAIDFSTLDLKLWIIDNGSRATEVTLLTPQAGEIEDSYLVRVQGQLPLESDMELVIDGGLLALDDGENILWEDLVFEFSTPDLPFSHIVGKILLEGKALDGLEADFMGQKGYTDEDGNLNLTFDPSGLSVTGNLTVDLRDRGYQLLDMELTFSSGEIYEIGIVSILPLSDWFSTVPEGGSENVAPDTNITFTFSVAPVLGDANWSDFLSIVKEGMSAPVPGQFTASNENKTVEFDPANSLERNGIYSIVVSDDLVGEGGILMFPVGNTTQFRVMPPAMEITVLSPTSMTGVYLDASIRLSFGIPVNRSLVREAFDFTPTASGVVFEWISDSEVEIEALFNPSTEYTLSLAPGTYGLESEPLASEFRLVLETGEEYQADHSFSSVNLIPEPEGGWETGQRVTISGTVDRSIGYEIIVSLGTFEWKTTVSDDGTWSIQIELPEEEIQGKLKVSLGVPGGPSAYEREYDVEVLSPEDVSDDNGDDMTMYYILAAVLVIIIVIGAGLLFMRVRKKKAEDEMDLDITEVDGEWEDAEE